MLITIVSGKLSFEYLIPMVVGTCIICMKKKVLCGCFELKIGFIFVCYIALQLLGLFNNVTIFSIKNILSSFCIFFIVFTLIRANPIIDSFWKKIIFIVFYSYCLYLLVYPYQDNTLPSYLLFFWGLLMLMVLYKESVVFNRVAPSMIFSILISLIPVLLISFLFSARTSLLVGIIIFLMFMTFYLFCFPQRILKILFPIIVTGIVVLILFYVNIQRFSFYTELNNISNLYFNKNIISGRSFIWETAFFSIKGSKMLFGLGTGCLPNIERYMNSSFHNSFIQILVQNGLLGLSIVIILLRSFWNEFCLIHDKITRSFVLAVFIGIIVYDCFETCLTQNKTFLGFIQWTFLALSYNLFIRSKNTTYKLKISR